VKLLLDEHYSSQIAERLRQAGHDVVSVSERSNLRGLADPEIFAVARAEHRALLTENTADFVPELHKAQAEGKSHFGIIFTSPRSFPRGANTIGLYVRALDVFLSRRKAEDALINSSTWLSEKT
jgi:Domain of unknown function (DUF5615)